MKEEIHELIYKELPITIQDPAVKALFIWMADKGLTIAPEQQSGWISVEERLPENAGFYLVNITETVASKRRGTVEISECYDVLGKLKFAEYVTHWQPLPLPPTS